jgi:N6-L-threonylcarbamoyladenine synthase
MGRPCLNLPVQAAEETMLVLGIESSCDETAAAVLDDNARILSSIVASQVDVHHRYGGVVPELASREHLKNIRAVVEMALSEAALGISDLSAIAVTQGPGLIGSLLVGLSYAKALAFARNLPLVGINHLEGHVFSAELEHGPIPYPSLILIVSGGHSSLVFSRCREHYALAGQTRDDAAGEAYDKVAKLLGLGYPGGPIIDKLAENGNPRAFKFPIARSSDGSLDLSFSGLKTAVSRTVREHNIPIMKSPGEPPPSLVLDLLASFQHTVVMTLLDRARRFVEEIPVRSILLTGGVACNRYLRHSFTDYFQPRGISVLFARPALTTDNAAMIAAAALPKLLRGETAGMELNAFASFPLTQERIATRSRLINN